MMTFAGCGKKAALRAALYFDTPKAAVKKLYKHARS